MRKLFTIATIFGVLMVNHVHASYFEQIGVRNEMKEINMPGDGDCMFWAVAAGDNIVEGRQLSYKISFRKIELRKKVAEELKSGRFDNELSLMLASGDTPYTNREDYIKAISTNMWGGDLELLILSKILQKTIICHCSNGAIITYPNDRQYNKTIHFWYTGNHYNLLLA